jgi:HEAT repeat protein
MNKIRQIVIVVWVILIAGCVSTNLQSKIPIEDIPENISPNIRAQIERLYSSDPVERGNAARALGRMGNKATPAVPFLIGTLQDRAALVRWWCKIGETFFNTSPGEEAAGALGEIGDARAVEPLIAALKDKNSGIRYGAAGALGEIGDARAVEPLIAALKDKHPVVRETAAEALGEIGDARAVEPLIAALKDKGPGVLEKAAEALGEIGDARAVEPLIAALKDKHPVVREKAAEALEKITGQEFWADQAKWQEWWDKHKSEMLKNR